MKVKLFSLVALACIVFSCKDVEEPAPNNRIEGVYEFVSERNNGWSEKKFNFVDLMEFNSDGTVSGEGYTTEIGSEEILGYRSLFSGTYTISEDKVAITYNQYYFMGIADINYLPKEDLVMFEGIDYTSDFAILDDYSELSSICSPSEGCNNASSITFKRVE